MRCQKDPKNRQNSPESAKVARQSPKRPDSCSKEAENHQTSRKTTETAGNHPNSQKTTETAIQPTKPPGNHRNSQKTTETAEKLQKRRANHQNTQKTALDSTAKVFFKFEKPSYQLGSTRTPRRRCWGGEGGAFRAQGARGGRGCGWFRAW